MIDRPEWWPRHWGTRYSSMPGAAARAILVYNQWIAQHQSRFMLDGLAASVEPIALRDIYVPLRFGEQPINETEFSGREELDRQIESAGELADKMLASRPLNLVAGPPGSGKSTFVRYLAWCLAVSEPNSFNATLPDHLVLPFFLREFDIDATNSFRDLIARHFDVVRSEIGTGFRAEELDPFLATGRCVVLLDGLDELGTMERRENVLLMFENFAATQLESSSLPHYLITSRPSGFEDLERVQGGKALGRLRRFGGFRHVLPFTSAQIGEFAGKWFELPNYRDKQKKEETEALVVAINAQERVDLRQLARRPSFLTLIAFVQATEGRLPDTREALYRRLVEAYVHTLDEKKRLVAPSFPPWQRDEKVRILNRIGWLGQTGAAQKQKQDTNQKADRRFAWTKDQLREAIRQTIAMAPSAFPVGKPEHAPQLLEYFLFRTGLLVESQEDLIQFGHLSFQEYLAAVFLHEEASSRSDKPAFVRKVLFSRLGEQGWDEVATLFMAIDAFKTSRKGHSALLVTLDLNRVPEALWLARLLGGRELLFSDEEREILVGAAIATGIVHSLANVGQALGRESANSRPLWQWTALLLRKWFDKTPPIERFVAEVRRRVASAESSAVRSDFGEQESSPVQAALKLCQSGTFTSPRGAGIPREHAIEMNCRIAALAGRAARDDLDLATQLASGIPETESMFGVVGKGGRPSIDVRPMFWSCNLLVPLVGDSYVETVADRMHMAAWLVLKRIDVPALLLPASFRPDLARLDQSISVALLSTRHLSQSLARAVARARVRALARAQSRVRALAFAKAQTQARAWALARSRALTSGQPQDLALVRALDLALALARDWELADARELGRELPLHESLGQALAQALVHPWRQDQSLALCWALPLVGALEPVMEMGFSRVRNRLEARSQLTSLLFRFASSTEAFVLHPSDDPITESDIEQAIRTFICDDWLPDPATERGARLRREFRECQELGIFPVEPLQQALADTAWIESKPTPKGELENAMRALTNFLKSLPH